MTAKEVLAKLKPLSNKSMIVRNKKNGATKDQFGVKLGDIRAIATKIKKDHALALELWTSENTDARLLSLMIIVPGDLSLKELDNMVKGIDFSQEADWMSSYVIKEHPGKEELREKWMNSKNVWAARAGWSLTAGRVARNGGDIDVEKLLDRIEKEMPNAPREVQWTMNTTLAYIGIHVPELRKRAMEMGEKMGIYRDYPVSKGCTSPFAPIWITEMVKRNG